MMSACDQWITLASVVLVVISLIVFHCPDYIPLPFTGHMSASLRKYSSPIKTEYIFPDGSKIQSWYDREANKQYVVLPIISKATNFETNFIIGNSGIGRLYVVARYVSAPGKPGELFGRGIHTRGYNYPTVIYSDHFDEYLRALGKEVIGGEVIQTRRSDR